MTTFEKLSRLGPSYPSASEKTYRNNKIIK